MNIIFYILFFLTVTTSFYLSMILFFYCFAKKYSFENILREDVNVAIFVYVEKNSENLYKFLDSLKKTYTIDDKVEVIFISEENENNKEKINESNKNFTYNFFNIETNKNKGKNLESAFNYHSNYDFYIFLDSDIILEKSTLSDMIYAYKRGYDFVQGSIFIENTATVFNLMNNLSLLIYYGLIPNVKNKLDISSGVFGNNFGVSKDILQELPYNSPNIIEDYNYHLELIKRNYKVTFIEEIKTYTAINFEEVKNSPNFNQRICRNFYFDFKHAISLIKNLRNCNKDIFVMFLETFTLPLCYYFLACIILLFSQTFLIYALYSLVLSALIIILSLYRFGKNSDLLAILYVFPYLIDTVFYMIKKLIFLPLKFINKK